VPVLRAALAGEGIAAEARGMATSSFWQVFAPYAPVEILVKPADRERAVKVLRHLLLGEPAPEREAHDEAEPEAVAAAPLPAAPSTVRRAIVLGACAAVAAAALGLLHLRPSRDAAAASAPRSKLELVRVDDTIDPFAAVPDESIPLESGIALYREHAPIGSGGTRSTTYARVVLREGESKADAAARLRSWLATVPLPQGTRFGLAEVSEWDEETRRATLVGLRTYLLTGDPVLRTEDVTDAVVMREPSAEAGVSVLVTLSDAGAQRFEDVTREWTRRRLAILVDDEIHSAPVIQTVIRGGQLTITMGLGDPEQLLKNALRLQNGLRP
jgi:hypothetical protein